MAEAQNVPPAAQDENAVELERIAAIGRMSLQELITNSQILTSQHDEVPEARQRAINERFDQLKADLKGAFRRNVVVEHTDVEKRDTQLTPVKLARSNNRGVFDTYDTITKCFTNQEGYKGFITRFSTPFSRPDGASRIGSYVAMDYGPIIESYSDILATGYKLNPNVWFAIEGFLPGINDNLFLQNVEADKMMAKVILSIFVSNKMNRYLVNGLQLYRFIRARVVNTLPEEPPSSKADILSGRYAIPERNLEEVIELIKTFLHHSDNKSKHMTAQEDMRNMWVNIMLSVAKQNHTTGYTERLSERLAGLQLKVRIFDESVLGMLRMFVQPAISQKASAKELIRRWLLWFRASGMALPIRLMLERCMYANLTTYKTIYESMRNYRDFSWPLVAREFPAEMDNFRMALEEIGDGQYAGFDTSSTAKWHRVKFLSVGWIAITLSIKMNPLEYGNLKDYRGYNNNIMKNRERWSTIIDRYFDSKVLDITEEGQQIPIEATNKIDDIMSKIEAVRAVEDDD